MDVLIFNYFKNVIDIVLFEMSGSLLAEHDQPVVNRLWVLRGEGVRVANPSVIERLQQELFPGDQSLLNFLFYAQKKFTPS